MNRRMTAVFPEKNQIEVVTVDKLKQIISYDALVICTGAEYAEPWKDGPFGTLDAYMRDRVFEDYREKIHNANSILCVGGGPLGIELACHLRRAHPYDKRIGILEKENGLLPRFSQYYDPNDEKRLEENPKV